MLILPVELGNPRFDQLTAPLGELDGCLQLPLFKGLGIGLGVKMMWWELLQHAYSQITTTGEARRFVYYGQVQYAHYTGPITFYELNAKVGPGKWTWDCRSCNSAYVQAGLHWSITASYFVHASDNLAFGLSIGYERDASDFSPAVIGEPSFPGYPDTGGPYRFFVFGLGFSTRFEKSKEEKW